MLKTKKKMCSLFSWQHAISCLFFKLHSIGGGCNLLNILVAARYLVEPIFFKEFLKKKIEFEKNSANFGVGLAKIGGGN
jgi:hypothetical protein